MARTYTRWVHRLTRTLALRRTAGERLLGTLCGLTSDFIAEGLRQAVRASWIGAADTGPANDALAPGGSELSLPRYPNETWQQYHARLQRAWADWVQAGHESSILGQLAAAGFSGALILHTADTVNWSRFWVFFPAGTHSVTAPGPEYGDFVWGDGSTYGPIGITPDNLQAMRAIIKKFKPGHWVCSGIVFELSGFSYGTGHTYGESGLVWGGETITVGVP